MFKPYKVAGIAALILIWTGSAYADRITQWNGSQVTLYSQPLSTSAKREEAAAKLPLPIEVVGKEKRYYKLRVPSTGETVFVHEDDVTTEHDKTTMDHASDQAIAGRVCASRGKALNAPMGVAKGC